jgi:DNA-binding transcriptional MerR regulator
MSERLFTITEMARRTGVSSRTIRFWSDQGLIPVARRSAARYRLYDSQALSRLELVRTLRELGIGLPEITELLKRRRSLAQVAITHVAALDARIRDLRLQRAVLRVVIRRGASNEETQVMQKLVQTTAEERRRLVADFVDRAFAGIAADAPGASIAWAMRALPAELPDDPSDAHVEAWIELGELLADPSFATRVREMALASASASAPQQPFDMQPLREHAGAALAAGVDPRSPAAAAIVDRIVSPGASRERRRELRQRLETYNDVRVERYWQLMGVLNDRPPFPALAAACAWFIEALRATE